MDADVILFAGGISPSLEGEEMPVEVPGLDVYKRQVFQWTRSFYRCHVFE